MLSGAAPADHEDDEGPTSLMQWAYDEETGACNVDRVEDLFRFAGLSLAHSNTHTAGIVSLGGEAAITTQNDVLGRSVQEDFEVACGLPMRRYSASSETWGLSADMAFSRANTIWSAETKEAMVRQNYQSWSGMETKHIPRWASWREELSSWLQVDLGAEFSISRVYLVWELACAAEYKLESSMDGKTWDQFFHTDKGAPGPVDIMGVNIVGRYVRMYGIRRTTIYCYSLFSFQVFGKKVARTA